MDGLFAASYVCIFGGATTSCFVPSGQHARVGRIGHTIYCIYTLRSIEFSDMSTFGERDTQRFPQIRAVSAHWRKREDGGYAKDNNYLTINLVCAVARARANKICGVVSVEGLTNCVDFGCARVAAICVG